MGLEVTANEGGRVVREDWKYLESMFIGDCMEFRMEGIKPKEGLTESYIAMRSSPLEYRPTSKSRLRPNDQGRARLPRNGAELLDSSSPSATYSGKHRSSIFCSARGYPISLLDGSRPFSRSKRPNS